MPAPADDRRRTPRHGALHPVRAELAASLETQLVNWDNTLLRLAERGRGLWLIKTVSAVELQRKLFVHELARGRFNVAEVRRLTRADVAALSSQGMLADGASSDNSALVRLAQSYSVRELPQRDLDSAVAGELVFSLWVRRRDPDVWNRTYVEPGIPVFYDLTASLDDDPALVDAREFFARNVYGYGGSWRVAARHGAPLDTVALRDADDHRNHVDDIDAFLSAVDRICAGLRDRPPPLGAAMRSARYSRAQRSTLEDLLSETTRTLGDDVELMKQVLFSDTPTPRYVPPAGTHVPNSSDKLHPPTMRDGHDR
jgi:hypothetical protein